MSNTVREYLIAAGVKNLREFGYPSCDASNILTDEIYMNTKLKTRVAAALASVAPGKKI